MQPSETMKIDHALSLAKKGFRVFPIRPNSRVPRYGLKWKDYATTNPEEIEQWWSENPNYNVGIATGAGTLVVDVDVKNGKPGRASFEMLKMLDFPDNSYQVDTPTGGTHVYLRTDHVHGQRVDLPEYPGIDIRCDGGYVVGPGSTIDGKTYEANDKPIAPIPDWFSTYLTKHAPRKSENREEPLVEWDRPESVEKAKDWLTNYAAEAIEGAGGDNQTFINACFCRDFGISEQMTLELMLEHWNYEKATPPWEPADLAVKVASAYKSGQNRPGSKSIFAEFEPVDLGEDNTLPSDKKEAAISQSTLRFRTDD